MLSKSKDANHGKRGRQKINKEERRDLWIKEMKVERKETETIIINRISKCTGEEKVWGKYGGMWSQKKKKKKKIKSHVR